MELQLAYSQVVPSHEVMGRRVLTQSLQRTGHGGWANPNSEPLENSSWQVWPDPRELVQLDH
jgi:hypothetical protein